MMKNMRILSLIMALIMVVSCVVTGYAAGSDYSEAQLLENLTKGEAFDFTQMSTDEIKGSVASNTRLDVSAEGGAKLSINHASTFNGEILLKNLTYSRMNTKAVKLTFVAPDAGTTVDVALFSDNTRLRLFTYNYNGNVVLSCSKNVFSNYVVTPGTIYSVIAKKVATDTISVYVKSENEVNFTEILSNKSVWINDTANQWADASKLAVVGNGQNDYAIYKEIALYIDEPTFTEEAVLNGFEKEQELDFTAMSEEQIQAYGVAGTNAVTTKDGGLKLVVGDDGTKSYGEINLGLTHSLAEGEAVKVTFTPTTESNNVLVMTDFQGSGERLKVRTEVVGGKQVLVYHTGEGGSSSARGISSFEVKANHTYDILVQKNMGKIDLYAKESTANGYRLILSQQSVYSVEATANCYKLHVSGASGSTAIFKSVTTFAKEVIPYTEEEILSGTEKAYAIDFTSPGSTGTDLANIGAAYNVSAESNLLEYVATNDGLKVADYVRDDSFPGFEFQKTGFPTKLENGAIKMVVKLDAEKPGRFEFAFNSGTENFGISTDITEDLKMRVMMQDKSYYIDSTPMTPGIFYTYIFKRNDSTGKISCFVKSERDEFYREMITFAPPSATSGMIRLRGMKQQEGIYTLKELTQYLNPSPEKTVLNDADSIRLENDQMFFSDDFDEKNKMWTIGTNQVMDGVMVLDKETGFTPDSLNLDLTTPFVVRFRHKATKDTSTIFYFRSGAKRVYIGKYPRDMYTGPGNTYKLQGENNAVPQLGVWYEYLIAYDGAEKVDIFSRREGVDRWTVMVNDFALVDGTLGELTFGGVDDILDDLAIYHGVGVKLNAPWMVGNQISLNGYLIYGTPDSQYNRRAKVLTVAYNKQYGYTEKIWTEDAVVEAGEVTEISQRVDATGVSEESNLSAMVWDDEETLIPLSKVAGYAMENNASTVSNEPVTYEVNHNEVHLQGYIGKGNSLTASLLKGNDMKAVVQLPANRDGMVDTFLAVDPAVCESGNYTLRVAYGSNPATEYQVRLACNDIGYQAFDDAGDIISYVNQYAKEEYQSLVADASFANAAYNRFAEIRNAGAFVDFYAFRDALEKAIVDEKTEREVVALVNAASTEKKWSVIQTLITETYKDYLATDLSVMTGIRSIKDMFLRMTGITYTSSSQIKEMYLAAAQTQKQNEASLSGNTSAPTVGGGAGGFGGGGAGASVGGGFGGGTQVNIQKENILPDELLDNTMGLTELQEEFLDLGDVLWAVDSINTLQRAWIISGDGSGNFHPNRAITREEFLKILMGAAGITSDLDGDLVFEDVDRNAWYYSYVNAANKLGIVNGMSATEFGIGQKITRADMAVMIKRVLDYSGRNTKAVKPAFIFDDFDVIPDYARDSISYLCEAELLNGVGENKFAPMSNTTRAEAAVAICRIYELLR